MFLTTIKRIQLASNQNTSILILELLSNDENAWVRQAVATNPKTPFEVIQKLCIDCVEEVRMAAIKNKQWSKNNSKNFILYYYCYWDDLIDPYYTPLASTHFANIFNQNLKIVRKEIKKLVEQGLLTSCTVSYYDDETGYSRCFKGYGTTKKASLTDEYKLAKYENEKVIEEILSKY